MRSFLLMLLFVFGMNAASSAQTDTAYYQAWYRVYNIINKLFYEKAERKEKIIEQTAILELVIKDGVADTFRIWSMYSRDTTNYLASLVDPLIGKEFKGFEQFNHVLIPITVQEKEESNRSPEDQNLVPNFLSGYKHTSKENIAVTRGLIFYIEPQLLRKQR